MNPAVLVGVALIVIGLLLSRRTNVRTRAGKLLAGLSPITPTEALRLAALRGDSAPYLAIKGSVDASEIFEDEHHRPLVFRRERVSIADEQGWRVIDVAERSLPFVISDPSSAIRIATADLADGHHLLVEMIHHDLRFELDGVFLAFDVAAQFLARPFFIELRVVLYFFNQAVKAFHRRVGAQHIEDETLLDRLLHRVAVEWAVLDLAFGIRG
jgi:hypothetical protein